MESSANGQYIKQIKLQGKKEYFPNKFYTPYDFMDRFAEAVAKRFDMKIIEVKYVISKSKHMKDIDDLYSTGNFGIDNHFNNIFDLDDPYIHNIVSDVIELVPPNDFDYSKLEEETEAAKKRLEDKKIDQIEKALKILTDVHNLKENTKFGLRSINSFKIKVEPALKDSEVEVYVKAVINKVIEERIQSQKNTNSPIVVQSTGRQEIRVYLHPVKSDPESVDFLSKLTPIGNWSLSAFYPSSAVKTSASHGVTYWSLDQIDKKASQQNSSIKIQSYISLHRNKKGIVDSLEVISLLFNEIVLKAVISLAQIKRIQYIKKVPSLEGTNTYSEYYLHLVYPPKYFVSVMKPDLACDNGFIRTWERVQNFTFLRNQNIMHDELIRLFLFGNSIFKIRVDMLDEIRRKCEQSEQILKKIMNDFKGTVDCVPLEKPWDLNKKVTSLNSTFRYQNFKSKLNFAINLNHDLDKIWKLKYLILVLVRNNYISPPQVQKLLNHIESNMQDIDIYIYIFWQSVSLVGSVNLEIRHESYLAYLEREYAQIKKLGISDITKKITSNTHNICYIFKASLTPSGYLYNAPTPEMKGRLLKEYSHNSEHFIRVTISDDNEGTLKNQKYITKGALKSFMKKINIVDRIYIPLGWSPSQLRSYSLWYIHEYVKDSKKNEFQRLSRQQVLSFLGSFNSIENPAKKAARIGQAFSASWTYLCRQNQIRQKVFQDDYSSKGYMFTDGIGKISADLMEKISLRLSIRQLAVLQIRYKGAKGILVKDPKLEKNTIHLRKSMVKYECNHESARKYLDILDWNKYKAGFLNRQTIILLRTLGIQNKVFQKKQKEHIDRISNLSFKDCSIFKHMNEELNTDVSNLEPANVTILHLLKAGFKLEEEPFFRGVLETMKKNGYHQLKMKSNIMIQQSARIIGIIDEYDILEEGQLYCSIWDNLSLKPRKQHVEGDVIITRNPCLHPADIRKMTCISEIETSRRFQAKGEENLFAQFVNCIIFPKKGDIPVTAQISGSDLDGDNFFISWDRELIPKTVEPVYLIDQPIKKKEPKAEVIKDSTEQYQEMLHFFIEYLNYEKLGQIDNSHLVKADQSPNFANDKDCIELAKIHGKAVDFPKTGYCPDVDPKLLVSTYPDFMEKEQAPEYYSKSILGELYHDIQQRIKNLLEECEAKQNSKIDQDIIQEMCAELKRNGKKYISFDRDEIRQAIQILLDYERELSGLITLVGVDTEYEIYSGNFTIAKDKVKVFGKNRLIATILALRARYFEQFFTGSLSDDRAKYEEAKENDLQDPECFSEYARRRAILFYLTSYVLKFNRDQLFLNDDAFGALRKEIISNFRGMSPHEQGKFCGFVWFVVPKLLISQKYRARRMLSRDINMEISKDEDRQEKEQPNQNSDEEVI